MLPPLAIIWLKWADYIDGNQGLRIALILLLSLWFVLLWLPLPLFLSACRRQLALNFLHDDIAQGTRPELNLPLLEAPCDRWFGWTWRRRYDSERGQYIYAAYLRPLTLLRESYEAACRRAGRRPYPAEYALLRLLPLLFAVVLLSIFVALIFSGAGVQIVPLLLGAVLLIPILHAQYQLGLQGLLLERVEQARQG